MTNLRQRLMPLAVLTAAVQEPNISRKEFENDPIGAALKAALTWIRTAREAGLDGIQLAGALAIPDAYLPPEAMLDPVASHTPVRTLRDGSGEDLSDENAAAIIQACTEGGKLTRIFDIGFFENLLHPDEAIRNQIHAHLLRCARAAKKLSRVGCTGVTTFIGRDTRVSIDENLLLFEKYVIPLLVEFKEMGLTLWIENCPMPGWTLADTFIQNIAYCPAMWITLARIAQKYGVDDCIRINYDASHDILLGTTPYASFAFLAAAGFGYLVSKLHSKDQNRRLAKIAAHTMLGQRAGLGIRIRGKLVTDPAEFGKAWGRMTAEHSLPGLSQYNSHAQNMGYKVDWLAHQIYLRTLLGLEPEDSVLILEHEWGPARDQNLDRVGGAIRLSAQYMRGIDAAADANVCAQGWCGSVGLPWETTTNPLEHIPGLHEEVERVLSIPV